MHLVTLRAAVLQEPTLARTRQWLFQLQQRPQLVQRATLFGFLRPQKRTPPGAPEAAGTLAPAPPAKPPVETIETIEAEDLLPPRPVVVPRDRAHLEELVLAHVKSVAPSLCDSPNGAASVWEARLGADLGAKFRLTHACAQQLLQHPISAADLTNLRTLGDLADYLELHTLRPLSERWFDVNNPFQPVDPVELFFRERQDSLPANLSHVFEERVGETAAQREHLHQIKYWKRYGRWRLDALKALKIRFRTGGRGKQMQRVRLDGGAAPLWKRSGEP